MKEVCYSIVYVLLLYRVYWTLLIIASVSWLRGDSPMTSLEM